MIKALKLKNIPKNPPISGGEIYSSRHILWRELLKDKIAFISLIFIIVVTVFVVVASLFINQQELLRIDLFSLNLAPSSTHWLGTDHGGRDVFGLLVIGARNSLAVGLAVTVLTGVTGILLGVISGYFGGQIDNGLMRIVDFFNILPTLMIIITFVTIFPNYSIIQFALIISLFRWTGMARLIRSKSIQEKEFEYIQASKTLGTPHRKIIIDQLLPNITSLMIVMMTLALAANIGIESGLSFLGFGFPDATPSLGTLVSAARNPQVLETRWWIWMPASILILLLMLSINNVGQALKRATDARQRRG